MESPQDMEVEGVTAFAPPPATSYRYIIELKSSKMSVWMEDRKSKKQWYKGGLTKADYVSSANAIPDASAAAYVECFKDTLDSDLDDSSDVQRKLVALKGGGLRLELAVTIRVLRSTWVTKYTFDLDPVSVERIDILESKLRDQQEELERLREKVSGCHTRSFAQLVASSKNNESRLMWSKVEAIGFETTSDGTVKACCAGLYTIGAIVAIYPNGHNQTIQLLVNGKSLQTVYSPYCRGGYSFSSLGFTTFLDEGAEVAVVCNCSLADSGSSYLSIL